MRRRFFDRLFPRRVRSDVLVLPFSLADLFVLLAVIAVFLFPVRASVARSSASASIMRIEATGPHGSTVRIEKIGSSQAERCIAVKGVHGVTVIVIDHGQVRIAESACPDHYCIRQGTIRQAGEALVCMPNRVVVTLESGPDDRAIDAVNR